jgi:DNA-binding CsgD family transcriptional regulator
MNGGLLERDTELAVIRSLIADASGRGRLLAIEGPPGIGKTSLIAETRALGQRDGMLVLGARGSELESAFSFGVVRQLFEPLLMQLPEEERTDLLAGAAQLSMPLFEPAPLAAEPGADASLAMLHGLYWLTANAVARGPLLLAIDDLHWCDLLSLRWLAYLLPRLEDLDLFIVVGLRPSEGEDATLLDQIVSDPLAIVVRPARLSTMAASRLVRENLSPDADDAFCTACSDQTGGNPLLLRELVRTIAAEGLAPTAANVGRLRELGAQAGSRTVSMRLSRLAPEATRLAQAVAILGGDADPRHAAALAELDELTASEMTTALARVDILRPTQPLGFVHSLIGAAIYDTLTPIERDTGHARAARLLADSGAEPERVAVHLLLAPAAADSQAVAVLREAARRAASRGASESAVAYLRRALAEPPAASERADLLVELGASEALVSGDAAVEHLQDAYELVDDPIRKAETAVLLGRQLYYLARLDESVETLRQGLDAVTGVDVELERILEAALITSAIFQSHTYAEARQRLENARRRPGDATIGQKMLLALIAYHDARAGAPARETVGLVRRALVEGSLPAGEIAAEPLILACTVLARADQDQALALCDAALGDARRRGSILSFASAKLHRAQAYLYRGDLTEAETDAREAFHACETWRTSAHFSAVLGAFPAFLADILREQGRLDDAASALARAGWGGSVPNGVGADFFLESRARLRLSSGDVRGGMEDMLDAGRRFEALGGRNPAFVAWRSQAALALLELGNREEASRLAGEELELARAWGAPRALGAALRVEGLVEGGRAGLALLEEAVDVLADSPAKLEHAKARTELGAALRRADHRPQAREQLRRAVELATICGAAPLAARAESELLATGARPRRIALSGLESLTPSERRVAQMAAEGPTNREIAQALFVTPKTVEVHLSSVYRKLGISSRSQLPAALTAGPVRA